MVLRSESNACYSHTNGNALDSMHKDEETSRFANKRINDTTMYFFILDEQIIAAKSRQIKVLQSTVKFYFFMEPPIYLHQSPSAIGISIANERTLKRRSTSNKEETSNGRWPGDE